MRELLSRTVRISAMLGALAVAVLMLHVIADTAFRSLGRPVFRGTIDHVSYWWMVLISLMPLAAAERKGEHLNAPIIHVRLATSVQRQWDGLCYLLTVIVCVLVAYYGFGTALDRLATAERTGAVRTIIWPLRFVVPIAFGIFAAQASATLAGLLRARPGKLSEDKTP